MPSKSPMPSFATVDDYIANQAEAAKEILKELRSLIDDAAPDVVEIPNSKVPSFTLVPDEKPKLQLMMAAYAKFVSFYPFEKTVEAFADQLKDYETGKGSVKFPLNKPLPKELISEMVTFRMEDLRKN